LRSGVAAVFVSRSEGGETYATANTYWGGPLAVAAGHDVPTAALALAARTAAERVAVS
jgi:hypothetical protein